MPETYSITEIAGEFGVTLRTLRFYEDKGLLSPGRQGMARIYTNRDRGRLTLILRGRRLGFTLAEIKEMLDLYRQDGHNRTQLAVMLDKSRERIAKLERQRHDIEEAVRELRDLCAAIEALLETPAGGPDETP